MFWCLDLVPVGLLVELVRVLDQYRRAWQGLNTSKLEFFSGSLFTAALKLHIKKLWWSSLHLFLYPTVQIHEIHIFISIFPGYITIGQPPVGLLAQYWWECCTGITKIHAFFLQLHKLCIKLWWSSLHLFFHLAFEMYEINIFIN